MTLFLRWALFCWVLALGFAQELTADDFSRPDVLTLGQQGSEEEWQKYFRALSADGVSQEAWGTEYVWFYSLVFPKPWGTVLSKAEENQMKDRMRQLDSYYYDMPTIFAWTFAAAHAEWAPQNSNQAARRARAGMSSRIPKEATLGGTINPQIEFVISQRDQKANVTRIRYQSMQEVFRLFYLWMSADVNPLDLFITGELLTARAQMLGQLHMFVNSLKPKELSKLALTCLPEYFPYRSEFGWQSKVLTGSIKLLQSVREKWTADPSLVEDYRRLEDRIRRLILQSERFVLQNFSTLESLGFVSKKAYFLRESGMMRFESVLTSTTGDLDIYLTVAELALQPQSTEIDGPLATQTAANIYRVLRGAYKTRGMFALGLGNFQNSYRPVDSVTEYAIRFLQNQAARPSLPRPQALELLADPILNDFGLSEDQRLSLEEARLDASIALLENEKVLNSFVKKLTGSENLPPGDVRLYAKALRKIIPEGKIAEITAQLESKIIRREISVGQSPTLSEWQRHGTKLVPILVEFDPSNLSLVEFLSDAFLKNSVGSWPSGMQALSYLKQTKKSAPQLKDRLATRLSRPDHGDTQGEFEAFLVLFPESGAEIMAILYNHLAYVDRLKPMFRIAIRLASRMPEIITSIRLARENNLPSGTIANFHYQGQFLDEWLQGKISSAYSRSCAEISGTVTSGGPYEN
ncbi:MAG: hypothetical protein K2X47_14180 [Bdellovibrionales bacterium]|nr:hypothetical protein [Bdellovibrionales bacterium]